MIALALHNTIILIITHTFFFHRYQEVKVVKCNWLAKSSPDDGLGGVGEGEGNRKGSVKGKVKGKVSILERMGMQPPH